MYQRYKAHYNIQRFTCHLQIQTFVHLPTIARCRGRGPLIYLPYAVRAAATTEQPHRRHGRHGAVQLRIYSGSITINSNEH